MMPPVSPPKSGTLFPWLTQILTTKFTKNQKQHEDSFLSVVNSSIKILVIPANAGIQKIRIQIQTATFWIATSLTLLAMTTGSAFAAINIPFTINLSENVGVTGTQRISIDVGGHSHYAVFFALYPLAIIGLWRSSRQDRVRSVLAVILLNSALVALTHDEWSVRFVVPLLPWIIALAVLAFAEHRPSKAAV